MLILDKNIFNKYIEAYKLSGIHHFNYGPGSPFNRKQDIQFDSPQQTSSQTRLQMLARNLLSNIQKTLK
jgi:hypothetical protein